MVFKTNSPIPGAKVRKKIFQSQYPLSVSSIAGIFLNYTS